MIKEDEITTEEVRDLALFLATDGQQGVCPPWHKLFILAQRCAAPVWEVEQALAAYDKRMECATKREWIRRSMVMMFAEAQVEQMKQEAMRRLTNQRILQAGVGNGLKVVR